MTQGHIAGKPLSLGMQPLVMGIDKWIWEKRDSGWVGMGHRWGWSWQWVWGVLMVVCLSIHRGVGGGQIYNDVS